jgi:hypothetical protein
MCTAQIYFQILTISSEAQWALKFATEITGEGNKRYSYKPQSDFLFFLDHCPRISMKFVRMRHTKVIAIGYFSKLGSWSAP